MFLSPRRDGGPITLVIAFLGLMEHNCCIYRANDTDANINTQMDTTQKERNQQRHRERTGKRTSENPKRTFCSLLQLLLKISMHVFDFIFPPVLATQEEEMHTRSIDGQIFYFTCSHLFLNFFFLYDVY